MLKKKETNEERLDRYRDEGLYDEDCQICRETILPAVMSGKHLGDIPVPSHVASPNCESGSHRHCSCDKCF